MIVLLRGNAYDDHPSYVISVAVHMVGVHPQTLRYYERVGLVMPSRSEGKRRLYSPRDIEKIRRIKTLTEDMGINLAGVEVVIKLMDRMTQMENEMNGLRDEVRKLRSTSSSKRGSTGD